MAQAERRTRRVLPEKESVRAESMEDGRYIPFSGGVMGWFENSLVLRRELPNNYGLHRVLDADSIRRKLFERWGDGDAANRRIVSRHEVTADVAVVLAWGDNHLSGKTKDFSTHGLRLQLEQDEDPGLKKGDSVQVQVFRRHEGGEKLFDLSATIMWTSRAGRRRLIWTVGLAFENITHETRVELQKAFLP